MLNNLAREGARYGAVRVEQVRKMVATESEKQKELKRIVVGEMKRRARATPIDEALLKDETVTVSAPSLETNQPLRVEILYDIKNGKGILPSLIPLPGSLATYRSTASNLIE